MRPSSSRDKEGKKRVFKTGFKKYLLLAVPALSMAAVLILVGAHYYPTARYDSASTLLYVAPWSVGGVIVVFTLYGWLINAGKAVTVTPRKLEFSNYGKGFDSMWGDLVFTAPRSDKLYLKTAVIGNGTRYERLEEFFWPEFTTLMDLIKAAKKHSREQRMTLDIDV